LFINFFIFTAIIVIKLAGGSSTSKVAKITAGHTGLNNPTTSRAVKVTLTSQKES
jgi:hypothetical protein